jgi:LacI family transcriptional regulator
MPRRVTAQDVADLAGVSRSTVSLVLNGRADGNISATKQLQVIEAARQLDYRPNAVALSLRSQRSWAIGALSWRGAAGFPGGMLHASWDTAKAAGYLLMIMDTNDDREHEALAVSSLLDRQVDAVVVVAPDLSEYRPPEALAQIPTVLINCLDPDRTVVSIAPDEVGASASAAQILIDLGHSRIGLLADDTATIQTEQRIAGAQGAVAAAGLPPLEIMVAGHELAAAYAMTQDRLAGPEALTGLICTHECLAVGALLAATRQGLDIPGDLSIVSLEDGQQLAAGLVPAIATVRRPDQAMAEQGIALLIKQLTSGGRPEPQQLTFVCPVDLRASVGPVPADHARR